MTGRRVSGRAVGPLAVGLLGLATLSCSDPTPPALGGSAAPVTGDMSDLVAAADTVLADDDPFAGLPAVCDPPPYRVAVMRDGDKPAGADNYRVVGSVAVPIPLVPNADGALSPGDVINEGKTTDLVMYSLIFGDEPIDPVGISAFSSYRPEAEGASRGFISIAPSDGTPLVAGDSIQPGSLASIGMQTTLNTIGLDFKTSPDELTAYTDGISGTVIVLGLTATALCIDADLSWRYVGSGGDDGGMLTMRGVFTAILAERAAAFS
jgi:hypothetical protein